MQWSAHQQHKRRQPSTLFRTFGDICGVLWPEELMAKMLEKALASNPAKKYEKGKGGPGVWRSRWRRTTVSRIFDTIRLVRGKQIVIAVGCRGSGLPQDRSKGAAKARCWRWEWHRDWPTRHQRKHCYSWCLEPGVSGRGHLKVFCNNCKNPNSCG